MRNATLLERFEAKYIPEPNSGCWLWTANCTQKGYGMFRMGVQGSAHRAAWTLYCSPIPDGAHVLHSCDTPACVNPAHLFLGTNQENVDDKVEKGRQHRPKGSLHGESKLTESDIPIIFKMAKNGSSPKSISVYFGVDRALIARILDRSAWKHVDVE